MDSPRRRVLFYSPGWPPGAFPNGIVSYINNLRGALEPLGYDSRVLAGETAPGAEGAAFDLRALRARNPLPLKLINMLLGRFAAERTIPFRLGQDLRLACRNVAREFPFDILEIEESFGVAEWIRRSAPFSVIVRLHGPWFLNGPALGASSGSVYDGRVRAEGRAIARAASVSSPSRDVLDQCRRHYGLPLLDAEVIPNPGPEVPEVQRWRREASDPNVILFVGRFDRHKGGDLVIDAFREIAAQHPRAELHFAGPDRGLEQLGGGKIGLLAYLDDKLRDADVRRRVHVLGPQSQPAIADLRRRAAVTVVASRYENFPMTVVEALAFGTPLVAPATGGIREIIDDGVTALAFEGGDAGQMAAQISRLLGDPALGARLAAAGRQAFETRFSAPVVARQMSAFYDRVLDRRRTA